VVVVVVVTAAAAATREVRLMDYRLLGLSGCAVSALALGMLTFGNETSEADSFA